MQQKKEQNECALEVSAEARMCDIEARFSARGNTQIRIRCDV